MEAQKKRDEGDKARSTKRSKMFKLGLQQRCLGAGDRKDDQSPSTDIH